MLSAMNASQGRNALKFNVTSFLRPGIHTCTLADLEALTFTNDHRRRLGAQLVEFLEWTMLRPGISRVYLGGGFISSRPDPSDIDVILETEEAFGLKAFAAIEPFFAFGLDNLRSRYSVHIHFRMAGAPKSVPDFRVFFQYVRPRKSLHIFKSKKGIVCLSLQALAIERKQALESPLLRNGLAMEEVDELSEKSSYSEAIHQPSDYSRSAIAQAVQLFLISFIFLCLPMKVMAGERGDDLKLLVDRVNGIENYPKFSVPDSEQSMPVARYTAKNGTFLVSINHVAVPVVYSIPMMGTRLAPTASNLIFYGPYPGERTQLNRNIVPDIVTKLGCSVFSFQFDGLGQVVSATPYWSEPLWFDAALSAQHALIEKFGLERKKLLLVGYSGGAGMVMNFAGSYPNEIEAVAAQAPNVVPPLPRGNKIKWLMVVNRGDSNRIVMKPFYDELRKENGAALYCETTPERKRGHYHAPSKQAFELIYDFIAGVLDQRRLSDSGVSDVSRLWPYAAPAKPLERYAIVKTVHLLPQEIQSGKFDLLPSLPFTVAWSRICPPEQSVVPEGAHAKLTINFPARPVPAGIVLYFDNPTCDAVAREVEDVNALAEHGYLVISSMTAVPHSFVDSATTWIRSQDKLKGMKIHLVGTGHLGAEFISKMTEKKDVGFKSICLLDFDGTCLDSNSLDGVSLAAKQCGMYGFFDYSNSEDSGRLCDWASELVGKGAETRGCFNVSVKSNDGPISTPQAQKLAQAEIQALTMVEALIDKAGGP